jgi:hypothetical protein
VTPWSGPTWSLPGSGLHRLAASADSAYLHGLSLALLVCAGTALLSAALVAVLLPNPEPAATAGDSGRQ